VAEVVAASEKRDDDEVAICRRLEAGETTLEIYNLG
jgi:4-hydroxy-4-methyl-2-oxoglutarate aldolase